MDYRGMASRLRARIAGDVKSLGGNCSYRAFNCLRWATLGLAACAAVLVPEHRIAAWDGRIEHVEPVSATGSHLQVQAGRRDLVNVIAKLVGGNERIRQAATADCPRAVDGSTVWAGSNGPLQRAHGIAGKFPHVEVKTADH